MKQKKGRNEICPCGSGKKIKNCCGNKVQKAGVGRNILASGWTLPIFAAVCVIGLFLIWESNQGGVDPRLSPPPLSSVTSRNIAPGGANNQVVPQSTVQKTSYTEIPGINLSVLTDDQKNKVLERTNVEKCSCGCGYTIAGCRHLDTTCGTSLPMARQIVAEISGS